LQQLTPEFLEAYQAVSRLAARVLAHDPTAMLEELEIISIASRQLSKTKGGQA